MRTAVFARLAIGFALAAEVLLLVVREHGRCRQGRIAVCLPFAGRDLLARYLFDVAQQRTFFAITECDGNAFCACTGRAADAVDVGFRNMRQVEVDDVRDAIDVDASGSKVRCNEHGGATGAERVQRADALALALVAMQGRRVDAGCI